MNEKWIIVLTLRVKSWFAESVFFLCSYFSRSASSFWLVYTVTWELGTRKWHCIWHPWSVENCWRKLSFSVLFFFFSEEWFNHTLNPHITLFWKCLYRLLPCPHLFNVHWCSKVILVAVQGFPVLITESEFTMLLFHFISGLSMGICLFLEAKGQKKVDHYFHECHFFYILTYIVF